MADEGLVSVRGRTYVRGMDWGGFLDGIEDDQFHIYVGRDSRMTTLLKRPRPAVPST